MRRTGTEERLLEHWTLAPDERLLIAAKAGTQSLGFAVLLKFMQAEGRFPRDLYEVPAAVVAYLNRTKLYGERAPKLARIRLAVEALRPRRALRFADELDIALLPKSGYQWMPKSTQVEVLTPGKNEKRYLAGGWDFRTGTVHYCFGECKTNQLFRWLLDTLEVRYPACRYDRISVAVDNYRIHKAQAVGRWLAAHPRFELLWLPTYCPRANPIERVFGDTHDKVTRNHKRKRLHDLVADVERHLDCNGPWPYQLSTLYEEPEITTILKKLRQDKHTA